MRFLFIDANYPAFLEAIYRDHPHLASASYDEQRAAIRAGMFGEAAFQVDALRALGHEAEVIVTNAHAAQRAWAEEHRLPHLDQTRWSFRLRRGVLPWVSRRRTETAWGIVIEQVRAYRPDVVYVAILNTMPTTIVAQIRKSARLVVAQVATTIPDGTYRDYDLIISSIPAIVHRFRRAKIPAELVPLAFEPAVLEHVSVSRRDVAVSFVGSFSDAYLDRVQIVDAVARAAPLQTWTADRAYLPLDSAIIPTIRGRALGRDMYTVLARSELTLNSHGKVSGPDANNLRLYEATGMGALLVTDDGDNLNSLFKVGSEVLSYRTPTEAAELVCYYLDHPFEASRIAAAGQARTLRDHTWADRMQRLVATVQPRL
jgi:spore maturation protein CgeB